MADSLNVNLIQEISLMSGEVFTLRWNQEGTTLAVGTTNCQGVLYNTSFEDEQIFSCQTGTEKMPISSIRFCPSNPEFSNKPLLLLTTTDGGMVHWNLRRNKFSSFKRLKNEQIYSSEYSPYGNFYLLGCKDGVIRLFDHLTFSEVSELSGFANESSGAKKVFCLKWFDENLFLSGGWNDKISIWDHRTPMPVREMLGPHICGDSIDVKGNIVVAASYSIKDQLSIWDWTVGAQMFCGSINTEDKKCMAYCGQFLRDGSSVFAIAGSGADEVYFYDIASFEKIFTLSGIGKSVFSMSISQENKMVLGLGYTSLVYDISK